MAKSPREDLAWESSELSQWESVGGPGITVNSIPPPLTLAWWFDT